MSKLFKTEDLWAIWIGFFIFLMAPFIDSVPKPTKWDVNIFSALNIEQISFFILIAIGLITIFGLSVKVMNQSFKKFSLAFVFIFSLSIIALVMSSQVTVKAYGFGYAFWALLIGLIISNTIGVPKWVEPALKTEFFVKTGLVLLGAEILFPKMLDIGLPALIVAWVVTPIVLISMYYFGTRYLKLDKNLSVVISTATSVCGVSAAIAASAASKGKKEYLTLAVSMTLIFTVIMMIIMPAFVQFLGLSPEVGGAWIGGTIDATGAVIAAGAVLGQEAMNVAAIVKMIQNIMIGFVAFIIAIIWTSNIKSETKKSSKISFLEEVWKRLPKFILGFIGASLLFSFILYPSIGEEITKELTDVTKSYRGLFFVLAFVSIGLESNFKELKAHMSGGKPIILYLVGQTFNILLTLLVAWLVFDGIIF
jgi:uncharacterized integral membrane protein (TIGR00698 family)